MPVHKSAKKRVRRNGRVAEQNKSRTSELRTYIRRVDEAIAAGDAAAADAALKAAQPKIQRGADKGVLHEKTASRKISRLSKQIKTLKTK
jgi:small subunit ribosomal protein S20